MQNDCERVERTLTEVDIIINEVSIKYFWGYTKCNTLPFYNDYYYFSAWESIDDGRYKEKT